MFQKYLAEMRRNYAGRFNDHVMQSLCLCLLVRADPDSVNTKGRVLCLDAVNLYNGFAVRNGQFAIRIHLVVPNDGLANANAILIGSQCKIIADPHTGHHKAHGA